MFSSTFLVQSFEVFFPACVYLLWFLIFFSLFFISCPLFIWMDWSFFSWFANFFCLFEGFFSFCLVWRNYNLKNFLTLSDLTINSISRKLCRSAIFLFFPIKLKKKELIFFNPKENQENQPLTFLSSLHLYFQFFWLLPNPKFLFFFF